MLLSIYICSASERNPSAYSPPFHASCQYNTPLFLHKGFSHTMVAPQNKGSPSNVRDEGRIPKWLHELIQISCKKIFLKHTSSYLNGPQSYLLSLLQSSGKAQPRSCLTVLYKKKNKQKTNQPHTLEQIPSFQMNMHLGTQLYTNLHHFNNNNIVEKRTSCLCHKPECYTGYICTCRISYTSKKCQ